MTPLESPTHEELARRLAEHASRAAPALLGCLLTVGTAEGSVTVRLTEVEAYGGEGEDPGAHSWGGRTPRNASLFGASQRVYIYRSYGIHRCLNLVADDTAAGGVLLRAGEVVNGRELAVERRGGRDTGTKLLSGPGRLGQGLGIELHWDGHGLLLSEHGTAATLVRFHLAPPMEPVALEQISSGPRVGVSGVGGSQRFPWRFWIQDDPSVSAYRPGKNIPLSV